MPSVDFSVVYYSERKRRSGVEEPARIVIGKDTRRSSYMFEYSLVSGLVASGADAYPAPCDHDALCRLCGRGWMALIAAIMISASHNPYYDNGIKLINSMGEKMDEETISLVEAYLDGDLTLFDQKWTVLPFAHRDHIGRTVDYVSGRNRYLAISFLWEFIPLRA